MNFKVFDWYSHTNKIIFLFSGGKMGGNSAQGRILRKKQGTENTCNDLWPSKVVLAAELRY